MSQQSHKISSYYSDTIPKKDISKVQPRAQSP